MDIKHIHCMLEDMAEYGKCVIEAGAGEGNVNLDCAGKIVDMVKDLAEAEYHARLAKCLRKDEEEEQKSDEYILLMFKEQYGEDEGKRYYDNWRYKRTGRYAPSGKGSYMPRRGYEEPPYYHMMPEYMLSVDEYKNRTAEEMRDLDRKSGKLYYTEPMMNDKKESRYDKAKRGYTETRELHKGDTPEDKRLTMQEMEKVLNVVFDEIDEMLEDASPELKNMVKTKTMARMQKIS